MIGASELFDLLSHEMRLRALLLVHLSGELCVCELCHVLECSQPKISRHLALLRKSGLMFTERRGQWVYYRLNDQLQSWVVVIIDGIAEQLQSLEPYSSDFATIRSLQGESIC